MIGRILLISSLVGAISLQAKTVKDIKFDGLVHISNAIAKEIIGLKKGEEISSKKIDDSIKKLYAQQYFKDIWVDENNGILTYHVVEKPVIAQVNLKGLSKDKNKETLKSIGLKKGDIYDDTRIKAVKENIKRDLQKKGYYDSVVEVKNDKLNSKSLKTDIIINKGENIHIKHIHFYGTKAFGYKNFKHLLANKEEESFGWLFGRSDGKLRADQLKLDAIRIKEFYLEHGYLDAKIDEPILKTHFGDYSADLTYNIYEGKPYKVGGISFKNTDGLKNIKELEKKFKLKKGKVFNVKLLRRDLSKIHQTLSNDGYAFANVIPDVKQDRENHLAYVNYIVKPNKKVYINNVVISGNDRTVDRVIRRELYLTEGDTFNQKDLQDSTNALRRTGYFNDVQIRPKQISDDKMDLLVNVQEASTGSIMGGISYGSYDGFGVNGGISDRNFLGSGIEVGADIDTSQKTVRGSLHFYNPRIFDSMYSLGGNIYRKNFDYYDYDEKSSGGSLRLGRKIGRYLHASLTYLYEDTELTNVTNSLKDSIYYQEGRIIKSALAPSITFDNTDDYYLPRSGVNIRAGFEYAGLGKDAKFLRSTLSAKYYLGLNDFIDYDLIMRLKVRISNVQDKGNLPLNEKLYLGGMGSVRGFKSGTLSPRNSTGALVGAKKMASGSLELSLPLIKSVQMRILGFYDYGMTGDSKFNEIHRSSVGAGIEWAKSPLGVPLQLYYAKALDAKDGDRTAKVEFTLGRRF